MRNIFSRLLPKREEGTPRRFDFVAFDCETSHGYVCQIALCAFKGGDVVLRDCYLVRPPGNRHDRFSQVVHGITAEDTENAEEFPAIWERIRDIFTSEIMVAHNISFDLGAISRSLDYYGISPDEELPAHTVESYVCTYRRSWVKLSVLIQALGLPNRGAHDATEDAFACGVAYKYILDGSFDLRLKHFFNNVTADLEAVSSSSSVDLSGLRFVVSGTFAHWPDRDDLKDLIISKGGKCSSSVSKSTDYLVVGDSPGPSKLRQANDFGTKIITEDELIIMLSGDENNTQE